MRPQRAFACRLSARTPGRWLRRQWRACAALASLTPLLGCGPSAVGGQNAAYSNSANAAGAAITAVAAGVVWAVGGGCRLQGCPYGSYCNEDSGFCDVRRCSLGCPPGTVCNEGLDRCQVQPPAAIPNDQLPQDNKLTNLPTMH